MPDCISKDTKIRLFADDALIYREINSEMDPQTLQKDLDALSKWGSDWQMALNTDKCFYHAFHIKKISKHYPL